MRSKTHDLAVFIGRFQPVHDGHVAVLRQAAEIADTIVMLVGGAYRPRSGKNPFTYDERRAFIEAAARDAGLDARLVILPLVDTLYNDRAWCANVRAAANMALRRAGAARAGGGAAAPKVALTGCEKDRSAAYLRWFPDWDLVPAPVQTRGGVTLHATDLRRALFFPEDAPMTGPEAEPETGPDTGRETDPAALWGAAAFARARDWIAANPAAAATIREEAAFSARYRARTAEAEAVFGHPIPINTVDAVIIQSGHVLTVQRAAAPGAGLCALPGGHVDRGETALDAVLRETYEEARLDMPRGALLSRLRGRRVFDHPERSERGWVRTEAFLFELEDRRKLEKVKHGSDAAAAFWTPLAEISPAEMFEDHFDILQTMVPETPFAYASILMAQG